MRPRTPRLHNSAAAARRYSALPRISSIGARSERSSVEIGTPLQTSSARIPTSLASMFFKRMATGEQAPTAIRIPSIIPRSSVHATTAIITIEITRYLRLPSLRNELAECSGADGIRTATTSSPDFRSTFRIPRTKFANGTRRNPAGDAISTSASSARNGGTPSAAGEALHRLPATVPAFCIWMDPTSRPAAFSPSKYRGSGVRMNSLQVAAAPMRQPVPVRTIPFNSRIFVGSSMTRGGFRPFKPG